jgi:hypothetical protein
MTSKTRLTILALTAATFSTTLVAGASAEPARAFRVEPVSIHNTAGATNKVASAKPAARVADLKGGQLPRPVHGGPAPRRAHPADEDCTFCDKDGDGYLCTGGVDIAFGILGILGLKASDAFLK